MADFSLFDQNPLDYRSRLLLFVGGGIIRFDPTGMVSK
jgi:hypothetical protein